MTPISKNLTLHTILDASYQRASLSSPAFSSRNTCPSFPVQPFSREIRKPHMQTRLFLQKYAFPKQKAYFSPQKCWDFFFCASFSRNTPIFLEKPIFLYKNAWIILANPWGRLADPLKNRQNPYRQACLGNFDSIQDLLKCKECVRKAQKNMYSFLGT